MTNDIKKKLAYSGFFALIAINVVGLVIPFTMALFEKDAETDGFYGTVSLRSYFESGDGSEEDPYVITRPRHLYNLSRLQTFGVFSTKKYFQLGKEVSSGVYRCYTNDTDDDLVPFLDMRKSTYEYERILSIGSEAEPFYGEFNGNGLEIKNLNVYADPEDAGLFGYTAHGSVIHDLFIDNITVHALGYESTFEDLYGAGQVAAVGTSFVYDYTNGVDVTEHDTFTKEDTGKVQYLDFDASPIFNWDGTTTEPLITVPTPVITFNSSNELYKYKFLISGDFLKYVDGDQSVTLDLPATYKFFKTKKEDTQNPPTFPLNASSSVSLVASTTDSLGIDHSKVISTLEFNFSLANDETSFLTMNCHLGPTHENNIGLVIGHCDGSISNCYVSEGSFVMNKGEDDTGNPHVMMINGSNSGLIGLTGGTVHNRAAEQAGGTSVEGKEIGVLDFSTVYDDIITSSSFTDPYGQAKYEGVTYNPSNSRKYADYLRKRGDDYITLAENTVSFNGKKIISNSDLGVFTVATDYFTTGMDLEVQFNLDKSVIRNEDTAVNDNDYYVYYSTGEYQKGVGNFARQMEFMNMDNPSYSYLGYHFPSVDQLSSMSFDKRDIHQNYFFRFKIDPSGRKNNNFYFADIDKTTPGGSFISHYFENKLVDKNGNPILADDDDPKSGVMLRNSLGQELRKLTSSFATPDLSPNEEGEAAKMFCINSDDFGDPASNMVNFKIESAVANVTVVAGLVDTNVPAALGVYKIDDDPRLTIDSYKYIDISYNDPDYAFFMPTDSHLAYFDYAINSETGKWDMGVYNSTGSKFTPATINTSATVVGEYNYGEYGKPATGTTRLFAHTFKLPYGSYCLGSATPGLAKIFYVCAQGQTDGTLDFDNNAFASRDEVQDIDFIKGPRFTLGENYETNPADYTTNFPYSIENPNVDDQRCYIALINADRSSFKASELDIKFKYTSGVFYISTTGSTSNVTHIAVTSYGASAGASGNTEVSLFGADPVDDGTIVFPTT